MKWLGRVRFRFLQGQRGFTLFEVVVAVAILGLIGTGLLAALGTNFRATRTLDEQVTAMNLATAYIEAIKEFPFSDGYPNAGDNITIPTQYAVNVDIDFSSGSTPEGDIIWVDTCSANETFQRIAISVSREGGKPVLLICTYRTKR